MKDKIEYKEIEVTPQKEEIKGRIKDYFFPRYMQTIKACSLKEAREKLQVKLNKENE